MRESYKFLRREVPILPKLVLELLSRDDRISAATLFTFVQVHTDIAETSVFIPLELVNGIVHKGIVENTKGNEQIKVFYCQPSHTLEQFRLQLGNDILQALLTVTSKIHEPGYA